MYFRSVPFVDPERMLVRPFISDFLGYLKALYTVSRPECPHCFYCGRPAAQRAACLDLCDKHWDLALRDI
jgi:hypothetical protein